MSTGYESGGFGLIRLDGTVTERARVAGEIARVVDRNQALFLAGRPPQAEVAILYNPMVHFVGGRQRATAYSGPQGEVAGIERDSLMGIHRALFPRNVPVDYVHIHELSDALLKPYKIVFLSYPLMQPEASAGPLRRYVESGGTLVAEARLGWSNEHGYASERIPGLGLSEVMGCRETAVQVGARGRTSLHWIATEVPGLKPGETLPGRWYEETLESLGSAARVAARFANGDGAAIISRYGKGQTLMLGSYLSAAYESSPSAAAGRFFAGLLEWAGVTPLVPAAGKDIEVRTLQSGADILVFVFNHGKQAGEAGVSLRLPAGNYGASDLVEGQPVRLDRAGDLARFSRRLGPSEVWVIALSRI